MCMNFSPVFEHVVYYRVSTCTLLEYRISTVLEYRISIELRAECT